MKRPRLIAILLLMLLVGASATLAAPAKKSRATKPAAPNDSDAVLVRIGGDVITRRTLADRLAEIPDQYRATYSTPEGRQQLLDRMVEERLWLQDAEANGIEKREAIVHQLAQQRRDLLIRTRINELMATNPAPSDSDAKAYYEANLAEFRTPASVTMRHIQLKTEAEARKVLALAKARGADWNKLVTTWTQDTLTRANGGNLGSVTREGTFSGLGAQPALAESAMALGEGGIGGPWRTDRGWHVVKVDSYRPEGTRPFEQVRTFILRQLTQQKQQGFYQAELAKVRARVGVKTDSAAVHSFLITKKSAREMFTEAQSAGGPEQRIAAYQGVVDAWPEADLAPQAAFMIGFIYSEELKNYDKAEKAFRELLAKYPKSELAASAQWMVEHMRTEEAPNFNLTGADSTAAAAVKGSK
ncbi:MAG: peptidyl-prolyl cis-trans isomerase [Candidatus Eisenbacteria bacterium]|nr:peptidyl-prolyl cis-trans isomerase [Candidatus Eisenbacteria bacterium]